MVVHVATFLASVSGQLDKDTYLRPIPGRDGWAVLCHKPQYSEKEAKIMAQRPMVKKFTKITKQASAILKNEQQKAEWQEKHIAAKREASRHQRPAGPKGKPAVPERLYDYIRWELNKQP